MKIAFTADLHIKLGQKNVPVSWAHNRYNLLIAALVDKSSVCDMLVIGGDIFDKVPSMEELEVYYNLVGALTVPTLVYPGNHESLKKDTTFFTFLKKVTSKINPLVLIIDDYHTHYINDESIFDVIPYNRLKQFEKDLPTFHSKLLFTHVRGAIEPHVKPEVDLSIFDRWQTVLAGDLHSYENSQRNILYPGSPVTTSFHRNSVDTGIIIFDTSSHTHTWEKLDLPQLIRKTIQAGEPMVPTAPDHTVYEIEGDLAQLGTIEDSDLIDKKVMKRETDTALILDPKMSLQEELDEYLTYILQLSPEEIAAAIAVLNDNLHKLDD